MNEALELTNTLINADGGGLEIPGLTLDAVAEKFVDTKYSRELNEIEDEETRESLRNTWIEYYKTGDGRESMELEIINIQSQLSAAQSQLSALSEAAASSVASNAIPSVITTGAAASVPNPAYTVIENKTKKSQLTAMLKVTEGFLVSALKSCATIAFPVPPVVHVLIDTLKTVKTAVNAIPV